MRKRTELPSLSLVLARRGMTLAQWLVEESVTDVQAAAAVCRARGCEPVEPHVIMDALCTGLGLITRENSTIVLPVDVSRVSSTGQVRRAKRGRGGEDQVMQVDRELSPTVFDQEARSLLPADDQARGLVSELPTVAHEAPGRHETRTSDATQAHEPF